MDEEWKDGVRENITQWRAMKFPESDLDGSMKPYSYASLLDDRSIRLIEMDPPRPEALRATIQCSMHTVTLEDAPKFMALSYTWAPRILEGDVQCDCCSLSVMQNLYAALLQLREPLHPRKLQEPLHPRKLQEPLPRLYWIDAICINQEDLDERNQQVRIKRSISEKANRVWVWLGKEDEDTCPAFLLASKIASNSHLNPPMNPAEGKDIYDEGSMKEMGLPAPTSSAWVSLIRLFARP
ncbi:MAG: hypothetical protein M1830_009332 [Pleopsidium flavum]|nr:MAG: hypothetical protein M1830_009332 [Pleopsidium flavum]